MTIRTRQQQSGDFDWLVRTMKNRYSEYIAQRLGVDMLFEVAIIEKPTKKEAEDGKAERLVLKPTAVLARDSQAAAIAAVIDAGTIDVDRARMEVLVRPFS